jgi:hypothetical protein
VAKHKKIKCYKKLQHRRAASPNRESVSLPQLSQARGSESGLTRLFYDFRGIFIAKAYHLEITLHIAEFQFLFEQEIAQLRADRP